MKTRRDITVLFLAVILVMPSFAQTQSTPNAADIGKDQAQQLLKEIPISHFSDAAFWTGAMQLDQGNITLRRFAGKPAGSVPIADEQKLGIEEGDYVLGIKVGFYRRGPASFTIAPVNSLPIEGITKTISVWVVGRNYNHMLKVLIQDYLGRQLELTMGSLNFMGWKQLVVAVPPNIVQTEFHFTYKTGIKILGFRVDCDPLEDFGTYYLYLDDLRAVSDLFGEAKRDIDDMVDGW
jgi:hypothetical protein